jgi:putative transposase
MLVIEAKLEGTQAQYDILDEMIRTGQFIQNKCLRHWEDNLGVTRNDLQKLCTELGNNPEFPWASKLNSQARQASGDRAWQAISRFYKNCREKKPGKKGYPNYKNFSRSVEYKTTGWKLSDNRREITFKDGFNAGTFSLWMSRDLLWYSVKQIKRVRVVRRADGYYVQFCVDVERTEQHEYTGSVAGIDLGLKEFYTDSQGNTVENPRYFRKTEKRIKRTQRRLSRRHKKGQKQSKRYHKARKRLAKLHLKVSRQRKDHAIKTARALVQSNDLVVYEALKVANMVKNHKLAKSISDASWYQFTQWVAYYAQLHGIACVAVPPHFTTQDCSNCGARVEKSLSTRTHKCPNCGTVLDRDHNAAINILMKGLMLIAEFLKNTEGHSEINAQGESDRWLVNGDVGLLSQLVMKELGMGVPPESRAISRRD